MSSDPPISFATAGYDHNIRLWQTHTGQCVRHFQHLDSQVNALAFSRDRRYLAAAGFEHVRLYEPTMNRDTFLMQINNFSRNVNALGFNDECQWMYTGGEDGSGKILDLRSKNHNCTRLFQSKSSINTMTLHRNQHEILIGEESGDIYVWDLRNDNSIRLKPSVDGGGIQSIAINQEGTCFAALNASGKCYVWSLSGNSALKCTARAEPKVHSKYGLKVEFSPDSTLLVCCGADRKVCILKTADFSVVQTFTDPEMMWVWDCAFSADSQYLLTASSDGVARLWHLESGKVRLTYKGHSKAITCLAFRDQSLEE